MADDLQLTFGDTVERTAHDLASMSGVDLAKARLTTVRQWGARGLALHHLAAGDMEQALKVMAAANAGGRNTNPAPNQPPTAAKETP